VNFVAFHGSVHLLPLLGPVSKTVRLQRDECHVRRPRRLLGGSEFPEKGGSEFPEPAAGGPTSGPSRSLLVFWVARQYAPGSSGRNIRHTTHRWNSLPPRLTPAGSGA
jgi:hypothetical protein